MDRNQRAKRQAGPEGDWVVFHERPFPERLSRAFNIAGAIIGATTAGALFAMILSAPPGPQSFPLWAAAGFSVIFGGAAFGVVYAVRCFAVAAYGITRKKQYVLDWQPADPSIEQNRRAGWFFAALFCLCVFFYCLKHYA